MATHVATAKELPVLDEHSPLDDYLVYAALSNRGLEAAFERWLAALEKIPQAEALPDPMFSYSYYIQEVETRVGPQEQRFSLAQKFPWFGKLRLRGEIAVKGAEVSYSEFRQQKLALYYSVKASYYDLYYLAQAIRITQENLELLINLEEVARAAYRGGKTLAPVVKAQVELGKLQDRLQTLQEMRSPFTARLNAALNRPVETPIALPAALPQAPFDADTEHIWKQLTRYNPRLERLAHLAEQQDRAGRLAEKNRWPDVTAGVAMIDTGDAVMDTSGSGTNAVMATLSINLPIWRSKYKAQEQEARHRQQAFLKDRENTEDTLAAQVEMILFELKDADRKINLYQDTLIPKGEQSLAVTRQAFEGGNADFQSVIDAQRLLLEFELTLQKARTEKWKKIAALEEIIGNESGMLPQHDDNQE